MSEKSNPGCERYKILITETEDNTSSISLLKVRSKSQMPSNSKTVTLVNSDSFIKKQLEIFKCQLRYIEHKVECQSQAIERINQEKLYEIGARILDKLQKSRKNSK